MDKMQNIPETNVYRVEFDEDFISVIFGHVSEEDLKNPPILDDKVENKAIIRIHPKFLVNCIDTLLKTVQMYEEKYQKKILPEEKKTE